MSPPRSARHLSPALPLFLILILALGLRLVLILRAGVMIDGDEALVGLQALHIMQGERPVFFYGQPYMGSLEAYLAAGVFALAGPSALALRAVPLAFAVALVASTYHLAQPLWGRGTALLAALLAACPPLYVCVWTVKARGGFVETLVLGALLFVLVAHLCAAGRQAVPRRRHAVWLAVGLLAGGAFWVNGMIVYYLLALAPPLAWRVWRAPSWGVPGLALAALGALLGASPLLLYNLHHGFATFAFLFGGSTAHSGRLLAQVPAVLRYFFAACVPEVSGAWQPYTLSFGVVGALTLALTGLAVLLLAAQTWRSRQPLMVMVLFAIICVPLVFAFSGFGGPSLNPYGFDATGRYTLPLAALLPLPLAALLRWLWIRRQSWGRLLAVGLAAVVVGQTLVGYAAADGRLIFQSEYWHRLPVQDPGLSTCLDRLGVRDVWMNHWAGYPLMFATQEKFVAADYNDVVLNGGVNRLPWTLRAVAAASRPAYVLVVGTADMTPLERYFRVLKLRYQRCDALPYQVLQPLSRRVQPREVGGMIGYQY